MKTKKPTAKLPRAEALYLGSRLDLHGAPIHDYCHPVAVIPCHTAAQARQICKAAPFLQLSEVEKVLAIARALSEYRQNPCHAVLRAMGLGGGK